MHDFFLIHHLIGLYEDNQLGYRTSSKCTKFCGAKLT